MSFLLIRVIAILKFFFAIFTALSKPYCSRVCGTNMHSKMNLSQILSLGELRALYVNRFKDIKFREDDSKHNESIYYFISNEGKLIRPLLLLASCNLFGGDLDIAVNPAFGIQLFHNFTLVHDDIMDEADIRRNQATVHKKFGLNNAIISGDAMMIYAYEFLSKVNSAQLPEVLSDFNKTAIRIIEGQQMDMDFETRLNVGEKEYLKMITFKTSVLLAECMRIGAVIANASNINKKLIYDFGLNLGLSFQIKDDWLDAFGSGEKFGKKIGGDIVQNKKTMLFIKAWELAGAKEREEITFLMNHTDEKDKIDRMLQLYNDLGINTLIENLMAKHFDDGINNLAKIDMPHQRKKPLQDFAENIFYREN